MPEKEQIEAFDEFVEQFSTESHRAAVILSAAKLDQQLYFLLSHYLLPTKEEDLLDGDSPLSTFSARIKICQRTGLIDGNFAKALNLVRKIRNDFAHELNARLDQSPQRDMVRTLVQLINKTELFRDVKSVYFQGEEDLVTDFYTTLIVLAIRLEIIIESVLPLNGDKAAMIIPPDYSKANDL